MSEALEATTDEDLVARARAGDERALDHLMCRYRRCARRKAGAFFLPGAEHEDVVQEGMIGLFTAVREFDPVRQATFRTFAELCVSRQIVSAVRSATRHKHRPLNDYVSLHGPVRVAGVDEGTLADLLPAPRFGDPVEQVLCAERLEDLSRRVRAGLSELETRVLRLYLEGNGYREIATRLRRSPKSVDNTLQRVRRKVSACWPHGASGQERRDGLPEPTVS